MSFLAFPLYPIAPCPDGVLVLPFSDSAMVSVCDIVVLLMVSSDSDTILFIYSVYA